MKNFVLNGVRSACGKSWDFTQGYPIPVSRIVSSRVGIVCLMAFVALMFLGAGEVLADPPVPTQRYMESVEVQTLVNFKGIFDSLHTNVAYVIAGAVGLSLSIFMVFFCLRMVKRGGR